MLRDLNHPRLRCWFGNLVGHFVEPCLRRRPVTNATPQLTDQVRQDRALFDRYAVEPVQRFGKSPRGFSSKVALGFRVLLVNTAPCGAQVQVGEVSRIASLPLGHSRGVIVFERSGRQFVLQRRRELEQHALADLAHQIHVFAEVALDASVSAMRTEMHEVRQWLHAGSALVKVRALPAKSIGRDHGLGTKRVLAGRAGQFDKIQRCHRRCVLRRLD